MDPSKPSSKRGAFKPRGDLQNCSTEDEDVRDEILKNSEPFQHDTATKKKKAKYLTVKSSGYGRASPSVKISASSNSSRPKLRHGDGSLAGELARDKQKSRKSIIRSSLPSNTTTAAKRSNNNHAKSLPRSASPAVQILSSGGGGGGRLNKNKRHQDDDNRDGIKKQKKQEARSNLLVDSTTEAAPAHSFDSPKVQSPAEGSYSQSIDIDPTPVKAAKQLLSDARKRAVMEPAPLSPLILSPVVEEKADCSEAVKADIHQPCLLTEQKSSGNAAWDALSIFADLHPKISQTQCLSDNLFSIQSGIASTSILSLIKNKVKSTSSAVDRSTPSELRKRLERREEELKTLKIVCKDLLKGKDEYVAGATSIELALREKVMGVHTAFGLLEEEKMKMMEQLKDATDETLKLKEEVSRLRSERDLMSDKYNTLQNECNAVKSDIQTMQQSHTDDCVKIALLESKVKECNSQLEEAHNQVEEAKISIEKAVDEAKNEALNEIKVFKERNDTMIASAKAREMEVCRMMDVDLESVDFDDELSFLNAVRSKVAEYQHNVNTSTELQNEVELLRTELNQAKTDVGVSIIV